MVLTLAQMFSRCGRTRRLASRRSLGTKAISAAATPAARMTARMIQTAASWPPEPDGAWKDPAAKGMAIRNSRPLTVQLAVVAMAPALTAAAASYPCRWKNLTRTAKTATSPPTSAVKVFDVSSATHRPNGSWPVAAPSSAQPSATTGSPGDQGEVGLVLDLLQAIQDQGGARIPVDDKTPQFRHHPVVGRVTAVDRQLDRLAHRAMAGELLHPPDLPGCPGDVPDRDVQVGDPLGDLRRRRQAQ